MKATTALTTRVVAVQPYQYMAGPSPLSAGSPEPLDAVHRRVVGEQRQVEVKADQVNQGARHSVRDNETLNLG